MVAAEDVADIAIYDARKAELANSEPLPAELSIAILRGESRLKALRKWRGLTQNQLGRQAGITQSFLSDLEARRRLLSEETTAKLIEALNVPVAWVQG